MVALIWAAALQGCATAPGPLFSTPQAPAGDKGLVYLYRTWAIYAGGSAFHVHVDGKEVGSLYNASYLALQLPPGLHSVTVAPGGIARTSSLDIEVRPGSSRFYEYDFVTGPLANAYFIGSSIEPRDPAAALEALKDLKGATVPEIRDFGLPGIHARLDDVDAVPGLDERGRAGYREWLGKRKPRAFVLGRNGAWNSSWGLDNHPLDPKDPTARALHHCEQRGRGPCRVYAIDDLVVWEK